MSATGIGAGRVLAQAQVAPGPVNVDVKAKDLEGNEGSGTWSFTASAG